MRSPTTYVLAALLLASLILNARLWNTRGASTPDRGKTTATSASPSTDGSCERRLQACQQQAWARAIAVTPPPPPRPATPPPPANNGRSDLAAQAATLCTKAQQDMKEAWQRDREAIAFGLSQSLADKQARERNIVNEAAKMREVAGLNDREAAAVERAYREKRLARIAEAQAALGKQPQDFAALLDTTRGLLADEDSILERISGPGARDAWRAKQLEGRTIILALVATMADREWDDSIHW